MAEPSSHPDATRRARLRRVSPPKASDGTPPSPVHWAFVEEWAGEAETAQASRDRLSREGGSPPSRAQCAALRWTASVVDAHHILMLGATAGIAETWLMEGLRPGGTLTVIDADPHRQALTRDALSGFAASAVRVITARTEDVLARLTDSGYDLLVIDDSASTAHDVDQAARLLRTGGVVSIRLSDHEGSRNLRDVAASLREDPRWDAAWLSVGEGLLTAVWRGEDAGRDTQSHD